MCGANREIVPCLAVGLVDSLYRRDERNRPMANPVVHFEIRSADPDATRAFYGPLFGWTFPDGGIPGYSYVETGVEGAVPGGISPLQNGAPLVTFFVGVEDVAATLEKAVARGGRIVQAATKVPGVTFGLLADPQGQVVGLAQVEA
jgi:predicted enzyme related to lactoylglutathione lyase